jgi:VWFA-related protein
VKQMILAGAFGCMLLAQQSAVSQQPIPDAPKPQPLPNATGIAPGIGTTPQSNGAPTSSTTTEEAAPSSQLPASAPETHPDDGPAPEIPSGGTAPKVFTLGGLSVNFVQIPFTVKDSKGRLVPGLTWRDTRVFENGVRQHMSYFTVDPFPLSVALVIDQSVTFDTMTKINNALAALQGAFSPYDQVAVFTYNNGPQMRTDFTAAQSARLAAVLEQSKGSGRDPVMGLGGPLAQTTNINNQQFDPNTAPVRNNPGMTLNAPKELHTLNDAILAAAIATTKSGRSGGVERRRVVYVLSDGKEYGSQAKEKDVIKYLQTHQIAVYATLVGDSSMPGLGFMDRFHLPFQMRDDVLPRYAAATGGQVDPEFRTKGIETSFSKITEEVRTQYTVGYYTHEPFIDGKFRRVEVRVLKPNLTVVAKEGYWPAAAESGPRPNPSAATPAAAPATPPPTQ